MTNHNEYLRKWRRKNPEKTKEYNKRWKSKNKDKVKLEWLNWSKRNKNYLKKIRQTKKYKELHKLNQKKYSKKHPDRIKARDISKKILLNKKCEICGYAKGLERHHPNYCEPLFIMTICKNCHIKLHRRNI